MKFRKKSDDSGGVKMELVTERIASARRTSTSFKRSKSFRGSSRFMSKNRKQTNISGSEIDGKTLNSLDVVLRSRCTNSTMDCVEKLYSKPETVKDITDLRGIVQDVKNKLSITKKTRRKNAETTNPSSAVDGHQHKNSTKSRHGRTVAANEFYSYENPTFDSSFDTSVAGCLYKDDPNTPDDLGNETQGHRGTSDIENEESRANERLTIIVGNGGTGIDLSRSTKTAQPEVSFKHEIRCPSETDCDYARDNDRNERRKFSAMRISNNSWLTGRGQSFRLKSAHRCTAGTNGFPLFNSTNAASNFYTSQGMEFLEGFGKKKQNQASNNLPTNINPLTAQSTPNIHVDALLSAVEHGHLDKARAIVESAAGAVNSVNTDGLTFLDAAVLSGNRSLAKMLVAFGAQEGNRFTSPECLGSHLAALLLSAEQRVQELGGTSSGNPIIETTASFRNDFTTSHAGLTRCAEAADEKQLAFWERRVRTLRKMLLGFNQARPPDCPLSVAADVTGPTSVLLKLQESEVHETSICTKFKVQWSTSDDFSSIRGERQIMDMKLRECRIDRLVQGQRYYLRVAAGNMKGWSRFVPTIPAYVTPSSWRDLEGKEPRYLGRLDQLEALFASIRRPEYSNETPALQRRNPKKKTTIKQLFSATSKFQKSLRRGIFLGSLLYHEDKVLVTNEDFLPVIEIDETYSPGCIYNDFHWLMKVSRTWDDVKSLRQDMEKFQGGSSNHLRMKILQAAGQMQAALSVQELGQLYHSPLKDTNGTMLISIVNNVQNPKSISLLNGRWLPIGKIMKRTIGQDNRNNLADLYISTIQKQINHHEFSGIKLTRGLYLGYLKMQSSVDHVDIFLPSKAPNVLPHCKIRDNPHVSADEWEYLKRITRTSVSELSPGKLEETNEGTEQQKLFVDSIAATSRRLLAHMSINAEESQVHRLYDTEVIELTNEVSLVVIVPPAEVACSAPGTQEKLFQRDDLLSLPIQVFEMLHLSTYQKNIIDLYSRLSCILELDTAQAQQNHREAFSASEVSRTKERLGKLRELECETNRVWKGARWLIDLITFARDRGGSGQCGATEAPGISMKYLLSLEKSKNSQNGHSLKRSLVQIPPRDPKLVKSSPGRGSWPGPNSSASATNLATELSKSEQQLPNGGLTGHYTRKSSVDSNFPPSRLRANVKSLELNAILPISESNDTILLTKYKHSPRNRSVNSLTLISGNSSPSVNSKTYARSFVGVSSSNNTSSANIANPENLHSPTKNEDYTFVNSGMGNGKNKTVKPTASVAAVATPTIDAQLLDRKKDDMPAPLPGILQVYAAYETGLASGTSLKLHVTPRTTAREVVDLVVKQLNMAVVLKGQEGPIYTADELPNFCLVAVIGARERCLRDDFKPLQLQNPWKKGRLYVRQKQDVLAALEHSSKHTAYL